MIPVNTPHIAEKEKQYVNQCLDTGWISSAGHFVDEFEKQFANYCDCKFGVTTTNGTSAIHLALKSLDIGPGDEVLVPAFTMAGSVYPIVQCGAKPVFVDSEMDTYNIDFQDSLSKITPKTKAIIVVHIYGHSVDMDPFIELCREKNIYLIEDAAEAHGALYKGRKAGSMGDVACFSFFANKIITTGEGGMIVSNNEQLINKAKRLKNLAHSNVRFIHDLPEAYNYRMTNMQAAIGLAQLERVEVIIDRKIYNANLYNELLADIPYLKTPTKKPWAKNVYWMYAVLLQADSKFDKADLMLKLKEKGIETRSFFYPLDKSPAFKQYVQNQNPCKNADELGSRGFYLPSGQNLSIEDIKFISDNMHQIMQ